MYGMKNGQQQQQPEYENVKSGATTQAVFFDAYVTSFIDNVLLSEQGLFGECEWIGGTVEWCQDGTPHLHIIIATKNTSPTDMKEAFEDSDSNSKLRKLEEWVAKTFCECNDHNNGGDSSVLMRMMQEDGSLLHVHSAVCTKYQNPNAEGKVQCRFEYGRPTHECNNGTKAECLIFKEEEEEEEEEEESVVGKQWIWKLKRDHCMALCHCDELYEVSKVCGGIPHFHQFCQFFGGNGADGQRVIMYCTNYTTKMGMARIEMKKMLLEVVQQAWGKVQKIGPRWSSRDRILWIARTALMRMLQQTPVPQAQAAVNILGLPEFYSSTGQGQKVKVVSLNVSPFVDYVTTKGQMNSEMQVSDFIYRGEELNDKSLIMMKYEGWEKQEMKRGKQKDDGDNDDDDDGNDDDIGGDGGGGGGVRFLSMHPQQETHWMVQRLPKKQRRRKSKNEEELVVNVLRRKSFVTSKDKRDIWALVTCVCWRKWEDVVKEESWREFFNKSEGKDEMLKRMNRLLLNEMALMASKSASSNPSEKDEKSADGNNTEIEVAANDVKDQNKKSGDWIQVIEENESYVKPHTLIYQNDQENKDREFEIAAKVGGETGIQTVMMARNVGFLPPHERLNNEDLTVPGGGAAVAEYGEVLSNDNDDDEFVVTADKWKSQSKPTNNNESVNEMKIDEEYDETEVEKEEMNEILMKWKTESKILRKSNDEHKRAIFVCVLYLSNVICGGNGKEKEAFSMIIQGGGGTGKTSTVIGAVKEFLECVAKEIQDESVKEILMLLAPTNLVALAIGGCTLDSAIFNRRAGVKSNNIGKRVALAMIDEYSMICCKWMVQIEEAFRQNGKGLFGGISVVWIGDFHQLQPIMGAPLYKEVDQLKSVLEQKGRQLWAGWKWEKRKNFAVLM